MTQAAAQESAGVRWLIGALSLVVIAGVALVMFAFPARQAPGAPGTLATLNAALNATAASLLIVGFGFIRARRIRAHRICMLSACAVSTLFLVSYLVHHSRVGSVPYQGPPELRGVYLAILLPHIVLAALIVPLALFTIWRGLAGNYAAHRRIARVTLPLWLYVSLSGVVVYVMLYHL